MTDARSGTRVALTLAPVNAFVVDASASDAQALARNHRVKVVRDHIEHLIRPGMYGDQGVDSAVPGRPASTERGQAAGGDGPHVEPVLDADRAPARRPSGDRRRCRAFGLGGGAPNDPMWSIEQIDAEEHMDDERG